MPPQPHGGDGRPGGVHDLDHQRGRAVGRDGDPDGAARGVLAGIGEPFLDDAVGGTPERFGQRGQARGVDVGPDGHPGGPGLLQQGGELGQGGLRRPRALQVVLAQHRDDLPELLEGSDGRGSHHRGSLGYFLGRGSGAELQSAGVNAQQREPVGQDIVHLPGDAAALGLPGRLDATFLVGLQLVCPLAERALQFAPSANVKARAEGDDREQERRERRLNDLPRLRVDKGEHNAAHNGQGG
jgi:hypothetical protein